MATEIEMHGVKSSNVESVGYDAGSRTMAVKFKSGGLYHYADVAKEEYDALRGADSVGAHLSKHVKGKFKHSKIG